MTTQTSPLAVRTAKPTAPQLPEDVQVLLFRLGGRRFCVPLAHVSYIATLPPDFNYFGPNAEKHFVFDGNPLSFVSLWDRFSLTSEYAEYHSLQEMLPLRLQDHLDWMAALEDSIRLGTAFAKARSPRECAFGKWFYSYRAQDRRLSMMLSQFETPHAHIHALADQLLTLSESGCKEDALAIFHQEEHTTLANVVKLFQSTQTLISELQRRIAVIVANGDDTCALGADAVFDIVAIPTERIKQQTGTDAGGERAMVSALIILDDQSVVPLLNWQKLCA